MTYGPRDVPIKEHVKPGQDECVYIILATPPFFHPLQGTTLVESSISVSSTES